MALQSGCTDLSSLLKTMQPSLSAPTFLFLTLASSSLKIFQLSHTSDSTSILRASFPQPSSLSFPVLHESVQIQMLFREAEGWTVVAEQESINTAVGFEKSGLGEDVKSQIEDQSNRWKMITLNVHSSLLAVGFIAAIAARFKDKGVPSNVVAGYYHDHIFVPADKAQTAMEALDELIRGD